MEPSEWKVFEVTDYDLVCARSEQEALDYMIEQGNDPEDLHSLDGVIEINLDGSYIWVPVKDHELATLNNKGYSLQLIQGNPGEYNLQVRMTAREYLKRMAPEAPCCFGFYD